MARSSKKGKGGSQVLLLLVLLVGLGAAGAWNYQKNVEAENTVPRPYRSYSDADLETLVEAYQTEVDALTRRYEKASGRKITARDHGYAGDQIREFERVQRVSRSVRALGYDLSEREATLRKLHEEKRVRAGQSDRWKLHLRRLVTLRA